MEKQLLRKKFIEERRAADHRCKALADKAVFDRLTGLSAFKNSNTILTYVSSEIEVNTLKLIEFSLALGKTVAVPKCLDKAGAMVFKTINSPDDLTRGMFGILEPRERLPECSAGKESVCIVPALAFDRAGFRLGYGKGYYDRFLKNYAGISIGLCYDDFIVDVLPINSYDINVNFIVTQSFAAETSRPAAKNKI